MNIVVFGASGAVGQLVVSKALANGHYVKAFVHSHNNFDDHSNLTIVQGDVYTNDDVVKTIQDVDVVISTLGSWGTPKKNVLSSAMHSIIPAMENQRVSRVISLTGAEARARGDDLSLIHRLAHSALMIGAGKILRDGEEHIALLEKSSLDWIVIRSPIMRTSSHTAYRLTAKRPLPWARVSREAVATAIIDQLESPSYSQQAIFIY